MIRSYELKSVSVYVFANVSLSKQDIPYVTISFICMGLGQPDLRQGQKSVPCLRPQCYPWDWGSFPCSKTTSAQTTRLNLETRCLYCAILTLVALNLTEKTLQHICIFYSFSALRWRRLLRYLFMGGKDNFVSYTWACLTSAGCLRSIYPSLGMRQLFGDVTIGH